MRTITRVVWLLLTATVCLPAGSAWAWLSDSPIVTSPAAGAAITIVRWAEPAATPSTHEVTFPMFGGVTS